MDRDYKIPVANYDLDTSVNKTKVIFTRSIDGLNSRDEYGYIRSVTINNERFGPRTFENTYKFVGCRHEYIGTNTMVIRNHSFLRCDFANLLVCGVKFVGCHFIGCSFNGITLVGCLFDRCSFTFCDINTDVLLHNVHCFGSVIRYSGVYLGNAVHVVFRNTHIDKSIVHIWGRIIHEVVIGEDTCVNDSEFSFNARCDYELNERFGPAIYIEEGAKLSDQVLFDFMKCVHRFSSHARDCRVEFEKEPYIPCVCPEKGEFVGYKRAISNYIADEFVIVKLLIPESALRSSADGRKCRCSQAKVIGFYKPETGEDVSDKVKRAWSYVDSDFEYVLGETIFPDKFDTNRWNECSNGIHFFMNFREAVEYRF